MEGLWGCHLSFLCYPLVLKSNRLSLRIEMEKGYRAELGPTFYPHREPSRF